MDTPLVSVLLPTYHGTQTLPKAIQSVLDQENISLELLVIDDAGEGEVQKLVRERFRGENRIRVIENPQNLGIQKALNRGLEAARGTYIARIDDDDIWTLKTKLKEQCAFLLSHPDCALVGTGARVVDEKGQELFSYLNPTTNEAIRNQILFKNPFIHSTICGRKSAFEEWQGYEEGSSARHIEDYDLWLKIGSRHALANLPLYAIDFTVKQGTISATHKPEQIRRALRLGWRWRNTYPNGKKALLMNSIRLIGVTMLEWLPRSIRNRIFKLYKTRL
jgi:glycosyltransferase involved in cell wall biosynthesis